MIDERRRTVEVDVEARRVGRHQCPVTFYDPPVRPCVVVALEVDDRQTIKLDAVDVGAQGVKKEIPALPGLQQFRGGSIDARGRRSFEPLIETAARGPEFRLVAGCESGLERTLAPWGRRRIDFEAERVGDTAPWVLVGRVQP